MSPGFINRCMDFFDQSFIKDTVTTPEEEEQPTPLSEQKKGIRKVFLLRISISFLLICLPQED